MEDEALNSREDVFKYIRNMLSSDEKPKKDKDDVTELTNPISSPKTHQGHIENNVVDQIRELKSVIANKQQESTSKHIKTHMQDNGFDTGITALDFFERVITKHINEVIKASVDDALKNKLDARLDETLKNMISKKIDELVGA